MIGRTPQGPWIACRRSDVLARLRLFCFPYAGAGASIYGSWADNLPREVEICPVQLPGRQYRLQEPPFCRLRPLVQTLEQALDACWDFPFAFFGHSMGALLAFELTRHLRRQKGITPVHLFVSAHRAPHLQDPDAPLHHLPKPALLDELRRLNGTPEEVLWNEELMELLLPALRADLAICETYAYTPDDPLDCPISALGGWEDSRVDRASLEAWRHHTSRSFSLHMFPGDHFFLHSSRSLVIQSLVHDLIAPQSAI